MLDRILHSLDGLWRAAVALYEPALFYAGAAGTAVTATMVQGGGQSRLALWRFGDELS